MAVKQLLSQLWESSFTPLCYLVPTVTVALVAYYAVDLYRNRDRSGVPVVGWISPIQPRVTALWYIFKQKTLLDEAYEKYLKHGDPCRIPDFVFGPSLVLLPLSELKWVISQPPTVLDYMFTQDDLVRTSEVLFDGDNPYNKGEFMALGFPALWLSKRFSGPKNVLYRTVQDCVGRAWGSDTEQWRVVNPTDTVFDAVKQVCYAAFLGYENSYCPEVWEMGQQLADGLFIADYQARCVPKFLRWQALWVTAWKVRRLHARFRKWLGLVIARRVEVLAAGLAGVTDEEYNVEEPSLLDTLILEGMGKKEKPGQSFPPIVHERILRLITGLIFSATQTTSIIGSRTIDLLVRDASEEFHRDTITKNSLHHLSTLDSALRESMRLYPFENTTPIRSLVVDQAFDLNGTKYVVKAGDRISFASVSVMSDPDIFENPTEFDAFRFAKMQQQQQQNGVDDGRHAYAALGYEYLAWGHGKTACPGRQMASDILKLMLAEMFLRYEMKPEKEGSSMPATRIGPFLPPDRSRNFFVRRRNE
ncbi:cytochrome P450 [Coniochaeta sp. 2T2.1]|nr:cytochrome P450 [Coniochaeta sp. 2T2.1]